MRLGVGIIIISEIWISLLRGPLTQITSEIEFYNSIQRHREAERTNKRNFWLNQSRVRGVTTAALIQSRHADLKIVMLLDWFSPEFRDNISNVRLQD